MKKVILLMLSAITALSFIGCEAEAKSTDFLSNDDLEDLLGEDFFIDPDVGVLDPPLPIIEIDGVFFEASQQIAYLTQSGLTIFFINEVGDEIKLSIVNPTNGTYTAQSNSVSPFVAQYTIGDGDKVYTTLPSDAPASDGVLILSYDGSTVSSNGSFEFTAFVKGTDDQVQAIKGKFSDVEIIDQ